MSRSDEEVQAQIDAVQAQRDQLAAAERERMQAAKDRENDQTFLQLKREELRIAQQLSEEKRSFEAEKQASARENKELQDQIDATQAAINGTVVAPKLPENPGESTEGAPAVPTTGQADVPSSEVVQGDHTENQGGVN